MSKKFHWTDIHPIHLLGTSSLAVIVALGYIISMNEGLNDKTALAWAATNQLKDVKIERMPNQRATPHRRVTGLDESGKRHSFILSFSNSTFKQVVEINEDSSYKITSKP